tara:strand:- start:1145 stop:1534 length:390 start_codon:yes stop_codon:yes gene_type:complete
LEYQPSHTKSVGEEITFAPYALLAHYSAAAFVKPIKGRKSERLSSIEWKKQHQFRILTAYDIEETLPLLLFPCISECIDRYMFPHQLKSRYSCKMSRTCDNKHQPFYISMVERRLIEQVTKIFLSDEDI